MNKTLEELRKEIDEIDTELLQMLAKRMDVVKQVGAVKNVQGLDVLDEKRRETLLASLMQKAESLKISKEFVQSVFKTIHDHAVELQNRIR